MYVHACALSLIERIDVRTLLLCLPYLARENYFLLLCKLRRIGPWLTSPFS